MKIILVIILFVIGIDSVLYASFLNEPYAYGVAALLLVLSGYLSRSWFRVSRKSKGIVGFSVGDAMEVTDPGKPVRVIDARISAATFNLGTLVIGSQGSGKTESVLLGLSDAQKTVLPKTGHALFDGKGDIDIYKKYTARNGQPDYFFSTELPGSQTMNLFEGDSHDVIERMVYLLIGTTSSTSFYSDNQRDVLMRVVPLLKNLSSPSNLRDLYVVLSQESAALELLEMARAENVNPAMIAMFEQWLASDDFNKRFNEIKGMLNRLFVFVNSPFSARLNAYQPDIQIDRVIENRQRVYFHMPYTEFSVDVATAITEMFAVVARKRQLDGPENMSTFPLFYDDWGKFFYKGFSPFQARCRSANMPLLFSFQSYAQLAEVSETFAEQLDDMTATKIILRCLGEKTGNYAVRLMGEYDRYEVSKSELGSRHSTSLLTRSVFRLNTRDLKALQAGEAYVSTLVQHDGNVESPLWKTHLPLPDFYGWQSVVMPVAQKHEEGRGLGFWQKYFDPKYSEQLIENARANAEAYREVLI